MLEMPFYFSCLLTRTGTDEIAKIMNTTPDNIRHISKRAKEKLQIMLKKYGISE